MPKASPTKRQKRGKAIRADMLAELAATGVRRVSGSGVRATLRDGSIMLNMDRRARSGTGTGRIRLMQVQSIANEHLVCKRWKDGAVVGGEIIVMKPWELHHDSQYFAEATSITTVDAQTVTATDGTITETWKVTVDYIALTSLILAYRCVTGESFAGSDIAWIDLNVGGRAWALEF